VDTFYAFIERGATTVFIRPRKTLLERVIKIEDINSFQKIKLFNAMLDWEDGMEVNVGELGAF